MSPIFDFEPLLRAGVYRPKLNVKHADPYAMELRKRELREELADIEAEEARRAKQSPPGLVRMWGER